MDHQAEIPPSDAEEVPSTFYGYRNSSLPPLAQSIYSEMPSTFSDFPNFHPAPSAQSLYPEEPSLYTSLHFFAPQAPVFQDVNNVGHYQGYYQEYSQQDQGLQVPMSFFQDSYHSAAQRQATDQADRDQFDEEEEFDEEGEFDGDIDSEDVELDEIEKIERGDNIDEELDELDDDKDAAAYRQLQQALPQNFTASPSSTSSNHRDMLQLASGSGPQLSQLPQIPANDSTFTVLSTSPPKFELERQEAWRTTGEIKLLQDNRLSAYRAKKPSPLRVEWKLRAVSRWRVGNGSITI